MNRKQWHEQTRSKERAAISEFKAAALRHIAELALTRDHLNEIFGMAIRAKLLEPSNPHNGIGQHYFNAHGPDHQPRGQKRHPAGTKLVRKFIRRGNTENVVARQLYAILTGKQYGGAEA